MKVLNYLISDHWCICCQYWLDTGLIFISAFGGWQTYKKITQRCLFKYFWSFVWRQTKFFVELMSRKIWNWQNRRQLMRCQSKLMFRTLLTEQLTIPKTGLKQTMMIGKNAECWWWFTKSNETQSLHKAVLFFTPLNYTMSHWQWQMQILILIC